MKKKLLVIASLIALVYGCNQHQSNNLIGASKLASQFFTINTTRDTNLVTQKGALIHIPQGALSGGDATVQLEVKEAYNLEDIVRAGLTTLSNGQPLSSGGMIYIHAVDKKVKVVKPISIATPASHLQDGMELYKGEPNDDGSINWTNPAPLPANKQLEKIKIGELIFKNNCASCHAVDRDLTGPALMHALWERELDTTYKRLSTAFIHNAPKVMASREGGYFQCLKRKFGGVIMTPFPALEDEVIDSIFAYVKNEANRLQIHRPAKASYSACQDSCLRYQQAKQGLIYERDSLVADNGPMVVQQINFDSNLIFSNYLPGNIDPDKFEFVIPQTFPSVYYQFKIETFGWYNVDAMMKEVPGVVDGQLFVKLTGATQSSHQVFLVIPGLKVYQEGGLLKEKQDEYGFYTTDGKMPLLPGAKAYVFALGEGKDEILFGQTSFTLQLQQTVTLSLEKVSREQFDNAIAAMNLDNSINIGVHASKNAEAVRRTDTTLNSIEKLKPAGCDCDCMFPPGPQTAPAADADYGGY